MSAFAFPEVSLSYLVYEHEYLFALFSHSSVIVRSPTVMFKLMCFGLYTRPYYLKLEKHVKLYWKYVETWNGPYFLSGISFDFNACASYQGAEILPVLQPILRSPALAHSGPSFLISSLLV